MLNLVSFRTDPLQDPRFHDMDPRIRIHIKMKRIRNSAENVRKQTFICSQILLICLQQSKKINIYFLNKIDCN